MSAAPTIPSLVPASSLAADAPVDVAVIGGGPAGLMAAEAAAAAGVRVELFDAMPSVGRKFLLAGKGGLNLTHAEGSERFRTRYGEAAPVVGTWLDRLDAQGVRDWAEGLGIGTFVGSSGKVFPLEMKAAPLLRAWVHRLRQSGVALRMRHRWQAALPQRGPDGLLRLDFETPDGPRSRRARSVVLALGGASWPRLGSDGAWQAPLAGAGVAVTPLAPSNCGFEVAWSEALRSRHAGAPLKNLRLVHVDPEGRRFDQLGEAVLSEQGLEGSLVYAASAHLRRTIERHGRADVSLDLLPGQSVEALRVALSRGRGARSLSNHVREQTGLAGVRFMLLREGLDAAGWQALSRDPEALARRIRALPLTLLRARPIEEAISSAGGVQLGACDARLMLRAAPGVYVAGEMLDWEAPTGGYLLTACLAAGRVAGEAAARAAHLHPSLQGETTC